MPTGYPINKNYVEVPLTKGKIALVDAHDYQKKVKQFKWFWDKHYANRTCFCQGKRNKHNIRLHRYILSAREGEQVDHINGNTLDCRRENLRICTSAQNNMNRRKQPNVSGYKGVHKTRGNKWIAHITFNRKMRHIGQFSTAEEAAKAYDKKAKELFGEFAKLNFLENNCSLKEFMERV
jgi:hypothetical protein